MQAIVTKYIGPTNHRGSRVVAIADAGRITLGWDSSRNPEENHTAAALALVAKLGWNVPNYPTAMIRGGLPQSNSHAYAFVLTYEYDTIEIPRSESGENRK